MNSFDSDKRAHNVTSPVDSGGYNNDEEWDTKRARRAKRKCVLHFVSQSTVIHTYIFRIDCSVLPLLFLGLLVFQLDRMNLASALTAGFSKDIKVNQNTINLGNQLMFMGIVIFEIPFNLCLQRVCIHPPSINRAGI